MLTKNKTILLDRYTTPDVLGYPDKFAIVKNNIIGLHGFCGTNPNANAPLHKGGRPWNERYAVAACTTPDAPLWGQIIPDHRKYKRCILINAGGPIPSIYPNPNKQSKYYGQYLMSQAFIHCGFSADPTPAGRGSAGCITLPPHLYKEFMEQFDDEEVINIYIIDKTNFTSGGKAS